MHTLFSQGECDFNRCQTQRSVIKNAETFNFFSAQAPRDWYSLSHVLARRYSALTIVIGIMCGDQHPPITVNQMTTAFIYIIIIKISIQTSRVRHDLMWTIELVTADGKAKLLGSWIKGDPLPQGSLRAGCPNKNISELIVWAICPCMIEVFVWFIFKLQTNKQDRAYSFVTHSTAKTWTSKWYQFILFGQVLGPFLA